MSFGRYLVGLLLSAASLGPIVAAAWRLRSRALPGFSGAAARAAEATVAAGLVVIALEVVGTAGALSRLGAVVACAVAGAAAWLGAGLIPPARAAEARRRASRRGGSRFALTMMTVAIAALLAAWGGWTIFAYRHGMRTADTLWYHLPAAARFVQDASTVHLQYFDGGPVTVFYPQNSELFHALGLLLFRSDVVSPVINLFWGALLVTAAWAIGRPYGRGPHCLVFAVLLLATPGLIDTQPGGAYNDVVTVALLLCGVAALVNGGLGLAPCAIAAAASGLALGTKFTMVVPALALAVVVVVATPSGRRGRQAGLWIAGLLALGGYWYVRNAVLVGNPVPSIGLHLGPLSLPSPHTATPTFTVAQYVTDPHIWRAFYVPGLRQSLGPAWWAIIAVAATGSIGAVLATGERVLRMVAIVGIASALAFLVTPQFLGLPGAPIFFVYNVRYAAVPLAIGLVLFPVAGWFRDDRRAAWALVGAAAILLATEIDPGVWPSGVGLKPFDQPLRGSAAVAGAVLGCAVLVLGLARVWLRPGRLARGVRLRPGTVAGLASAGALGAVVFGGWAVADGYARDRYRGTAPIPAIYRWAQGLDHARIGIVGFTEQYPLYGKDASNYVQYIGTSQPHRGFTSITSCQGWRRAVDAGRYGWVIVAPIGFPLAVSHQVAPEVTWMGSTGAATAALAEHPAGNRAGQPMVVFRIHGRLDPARCPASATPVRSQLRDG